MLQLQPSNHWHWNGDPPVVTASTPGRALKQALHSIVERRHDAGLDGEGGALGGQHEPAEQLADVVHLALNHEDDGGVTEVALGWGTTTPQKHH